MAEKYKLKIIDKRQKASFEIKITYIIIQVE